MWISNEKHPVQLDWFCVLIRNHTLANFAFWSMCQLIPVDQFRKWKGNFYVTPFPNSIVLFRFYFLLSSLFGLNWTIWNLDLVRFSFCHKINVYKTKETNWIIFHRHLFSRITRHTNRDLIWYRVTRWSLFLIHPFCLIKQPYHCCCCSIFQSNRTLFGSDYTTLSVKKSKWDSVRETHTHGEWERKPVNLISVQLWLTCHKNLTHINRARTHACIAHIFNL